MAAFHRAVDTYLHKFPFHPMMIILALEKLETAVDHQWVDVCLKCGARQLEQDDERIGLVIVQCLVRDKRLNDVVTDCSFLRVSEVDPVCDEISVYAEPERLKASPIVVFVPHGRRIITEEFSEGFRVEVILQPEATRGTSVIRFRIACKTNDQVSSRVDELTALGVYHRTCRSVIPDSIEDLVVRGSLVVLSYNKP